MPESGTMTLHFVLKCKRHLSANSGAVRLSHYHSTANNMTYDNCNTPEGVSTLTKPKICTKRGLVYNIGINDHKAPVNIDNKIIKSYSHWRDMLARCYSTLRLKKYPTYIDCSVAEEWHLFSNFERWFASNYVEGWHLDKDILVPGNKVYSSKTCVFVSPALNALLTDNKASRGEFPLGVCFHKASQKFEATICTKTIQRYLGIFTTQLEAHRAYQLAKVDSLITAETDDPRIRAALDLRAAKIRDDYTNSRITVKI